MNNKDFDTVVIGGGPSGMICAGFAGRTGKKVLIVEKNYVLGEKLKLTGGGRCNITNAEFDTETFLNNFPNAKKFLYSPFSKFGVQDTFDFFESLGLPLVIEARKRAFPKSQSAQDVIDKLKVFMKSNNVTIKNNTAVISMEQKDGVIKSVTLSSGEKITANNFVLATGGLAAPQTGSTGDGFKFLKKLGHTIDKSEPDIVPLTTDAPWVHSLSGLDWSFMEISFIQENKVKLKKLGKILFTHFGISGPLVLNSAREVKQLLANGPVTASIDLFPDTSETELDKRILKLFEKNTNSKVKNVLPELIFKNICLEILNLSDINMSERIINSINKEERKNLTKKLKNLTFPITGTLGFDHAVSSDGGINPKEVNFNNMTSRLYPNLYLLGDIIHINRPSGGFSLQLCWTTGAVAGKHISTLA
ncbi:MAG: FAD dependent oxidoreductase [Candidatus Moranbacteria bacterium GW2011_GWF1_35_5]|nr:MAG: FAD dependent oxidoreductase [Candidatus Moranbacteria bacterium GW2011_GWE2_35_164]KKP81990.1 MAG: FAD dependent oxidoreductase [Candidatus Moranbacteria bacterium GW2011_GWF2_35_54]KKP82475.1 MAG: FAD dependent oxidoreductase [Candidatus Moranbacteria bacterium GW2011_GWF1_35_5]